MTEPEKRRNYPEHIVRKKETKPRKPGGGRKPTGRTTTNLRLTVKTLWYEKAKAKSQSMGIALDRFCRELLTEASQFKYPEDFPKEEK